MTMIVNPYKNPERLTTYAGTRILQEDFGIVGAVVADTAEKYRLWRVQALYSPIPKRSRGGIRAKLTDQKGVVTFCNQMDLEVLLGIAKPGSYCWWAEEEYPAPGDREFTSTRRKTWRSTTSSSGTVTPTPESARTSACRLSASGGPGWSVRGLRGN